MCVLIALRNKKTESEDSVFLIKSISGILSLVSKVIVISLGLSLPKDSSNLPSRLGRAALSVGIFGLAARKVYPETMLP